MAKKIGINGVVRDMTPEEETAFDADCVVQNTKQEERKVDLSWCASTAATGNI